MFLNNIGSVDRLIRFLLGMLLLFFPLIANLDASSVIGFFSLLLGFLLCLTSIINTCPVYRALRSHTPTQD